LEAEKYRYKNRKDNTKVVVSGALGLEKKNTANT
jgi:hypothetical protein